ncbi:MAG: S-layer homology domain-containing protein [Oscillospiraceae bacterium]|nr:S-layer homology domain-containing protein [Oscillospiraceae bacterium]
MNKPLALLLSVCLAVSLCVFSVCAVNVPTGPDQVCSPQEWEVLKQTNRERLAAGLVPYSTFPAMQNAATVREEELATLYSHSRPNGSQCFTVLTENGLGYRAAGENIAAGQTSPDAVIKAWMDSDGHRKNILDVTFSHMGVGYTDRSCTIVKEDTTAQLPNGWVQLFLDQNCSIAAITLSQLSVTCPVGGSLEDLDLYIQAACPAHGTCYLPVLAEMCTGFDPNTVGAQTVTVSCAGLTATLLVHVGTQPLDTSGADGWAVDWLTKADALGLLSERNRTGFSANVTRLQFADLAVSLGEALTGTPIVPVEETAFTDTTEEIIRKAKAAGIASGYQAGDGFEFRPNNPITRQEICVMLAHVADYVTAQQSEPTQLDRTESIKGTFTDADKVANWAVKQVALMTNNSIMGGKATATGSALEPESNTTLQEAVTLSVKLNDIFK